MLFKPALLSHSMKLPSARMAPSMSRCTPAPTFSKFAPAPIATGLVPPITVTVIAPDGHSKTARIEIETVVAVELGRIEISALRLGDDAGNKSRS